MVRMKRDPTPAVEPQAGASEVAALLGATTAPRPRRALRWLAIALAAAGLVAAGTFAYLRNHEEANATRYVSEPVRRGDILATVSATGRLQPTNQVDVGSELSGTVARVFVEENDRVQQGQVLAQLDLSRLQDQVTKSAAALAAAEAQLHQMEATQAESRANLARLQQVAELSGGKVPSKAEMEAAEAALKRAVANVANARASIGQAQAQLKSDRTNLSKASIRSPIHGVVLARKVEPGQTVAASLQAPVLFTIAENLSQMKLEVDVDEADVGRVQQGQDATFSVDAYPNRRYPSQVQRVDYGSQLKENVVSYQTVLGVENADLTLRPGMTATAEIVTAERRNVLVVPNAALRFTPPAKPAAEKTDGGLLRSMIPRPPMRGARQPAANAKLKGAQQRVWLAQNGELVAVSITVGATDGRSTEVTGGDLREGMQVVTEAPSVAK
jgi:HlyD family secretion protein